MGQLRAADELRAGVMGVRRAAAVLALSAMSLGGCATFSGQPEPVITVQMSDEALADYRVPAILRKYGTLNGRAQRAYRDEVVAVYVQAIDARFYQFRGNLNSEGKATNLGFDSLLVGLVGAAALAPTSAADLAIISTGVLGLRSSVDRNLFFDRTLPALLAAMDAERFRIRTAMAQHMAQDTAQYPLVAALVELQEYQQAGTLNSAIAAITSDAAADREEAKDAFEKRVRFTCNSEDEVNAAVAPVRSFLRQLTITAEEDAASGHTGGINRLRAAVDAMGVSGVGTMDIPALELAIDDAMLGGFCKLDEIEGLKRELGKAPVNFQG